ncbi:nuclease-related domain-containing protein [Bacillus sp. S/N-304-OC-R1]|uniref:nuclease-related domain-containing protein n=1 Tax=Bacillus sp. S/N-304-OC-R1 TaxID=2758034 RepID=UPI001C8D51BF|nr:nuclease-related domain-containing protein [Bacillus sp. S/N-304-OC-R1]MBY0121952.1 NERD domain-containing protein [Bacillus sp. S/N-304-OC-R1]
MNLKPRSISNELVIMRSLNNRMELSEKDKRHYSNLEKGYQGELIFDQLTEKIQSDIYIINDLCLEYNRSIFQIDTLIISQKTIFPIEIKNYEGDYHYSSDEFRTLLSNHEITNPLDQLKRSKTLLASLLKNNGIYLPIEGYVTFVNPEFTLYQAPVIASIILPTQLNRFIKKLNDTPSKLNPQHRELADLLMEIHLSKSPFTRLPSYDYSQLQKGITCIACLSFETICNEKKIVCNSCGYAEDIDFGVLRNVEELKCLFPNNKITTNYVHDWCKIVKSQKTIRRILLQNLESIGAKKHRYFV